MTDSSDVLRYGDMTHGSTGERLGGQCLVWCPACDEVHRFIVTDDTGFTPTGPVWGWDRDAERPTFDGSLLHNIDASAPGFRCHSFLRGGVWQFLDDCTHGLRGEHAMVTLPDWLREAP